MLVQPLFAPSQPTPTTTRRSPATADSAHSSSLSSIPYFGSLGSGSNGTSVEGTSEGRRGGGVKLVGPQFGIYNTKEKLRQKQTHRWRFSVMAFMTASFIVLMLLFGFSLMENSVTLDLTTKETFLLHINTYLYHNIEFFGSSSLLSLLLTLEINLDLLPPILSIQSLL